MDGPQKGLSFVARNRGGAHNQSESEKKWIMMDNNG